MTRDNLTARGVVLALRPAPYLVRNLAEGDVFSVDGGYTWYVCAVNGAASGFIAVYVDATRSPDSATLRLFTTEDVPCLVLRASLVSREARPDRRVVIDVVGLAEVQLLLGCKTRQHAHYLSCRADFPAPVAELAAGRVWLREDVQTFGRHWHPARFDAP